MHNKTKLIVNFDLVFRVFIAFVGFKSDVLKDVKCKSQIVCGKYLRKFLCDNPKKF